MPLVWAHAEYVKLCRSLRERRVFDMPPQAAQRYAVEQDRLAAYDLALQLIRAAICLRSNTLRIELLAPASVHWSSDGWQTSHDDETRDTGLGVYVADLPNDLAASSAINFTFRWLDADRWEGRNYTVQIQERS